MPLNAARFPVLYEGSVKNVLGPKPLPSGEPAVCFEYTDAYSVFDWGRMPDALAGKGEALTAMAARFFEELESAREWSSLDREFERAREASPFPEAFTREWLVLAREGLRTHYVEREASAPRLWVKQAAVERPRIERILGKEIVVYPRVPTAKGLRLVPLEVVFRFGVTEGSSILKRLGKESGVFEAMGYPSDFPLARETVGFPFLETFTKLESTDRRLELSEALSVSGLGAAEFEALLMRTAAVAVWLKKRWSRIGVELIDGKLEWAVGPEGFVLVDAIGPDELRLHVEGESLSKEFLRAHYRTSAWHEEMERAKRDAAFRGVTDWKASVKLEPEPLPVDLKRTAERIYVELAQALAGRGAPDALREVAQEIREARLAQGTEGGHA